MTKPEVYKYTHPHIFTSGLSSFYSIHFQKNQKNIMKPFVNLLWTGGLDSTFRLVELSREEATIQPIYILDPTRGSIHREINAMNRIYEVLKTKNQTKAVLLDIKFIDFNSINQNKKITESWNFFSDSYKLGSQYDYIARFALQYDLLLEVGLENSIRSKATTVLKKHGKLAQDNYLNNNILWGSI